MSRVKEILASVFGVDPGLINDLSSPDTIEAWDSLKHMNLVVALEEEFNVKFSDDDIVEMMNLKLIETILAEKGKL